MEDIMRYDTIDKFSDDTSLTPLGIRCSIREALGTRTDVLTEGHKQISTAATASTERSVQHGFTCVYLSCIVPGRVVHPSLLKNRRLSTLQGPIETESD